MPKSETLAAIEQAYETAPPPAAEYLDSILRRAFFSALMRMSLLCKSTGAIAPDKLPSLTKHFKHFLAMEAAEHKGASSQFTATIEQISVDIAEFLDKQIKRVYLNSELVSYDAFLDLREGHAMIVRGLCTLVVPDDVVAELKQARGDGK